MKRRSFILMLTIAVIMLSACQKKYNTPYGLYNIICKEANITEAENITYAGSNVKDGYALLWYVSGDDIYNLEYIPAECYVTSENKYIFNRIYNPMDRGYNIAVLQWQGGYSFLVNNPECTQIKIRNGTEIKEIDVTQYPFVYYNNILPNEYDFLDNEGNILTH